MGSEFKLFQPTATKQSYLKHALAIDDGTGLSSVSYKSVADAILAEQEKELPADHPYLFSLGFSTSCNGNRQSAHTRNTPQVHTLVKQRTNSGNRQKTAKIVKH